MMFAKLLGSDSSSKFQNQNRQAGNQRSSRKPEKQKSNVGRQSKNLGSRRDPESSLIDLVEKSQ
jgi:hypothetical protein